MEASAASTACADRTHDWTSGSRCLLSKPECHAVEQVCKLRSSGQPCAPTPRCPRCDTMSLRPHICPSPRPLAALAGLFDRVFVLCAGTGTEHDNCLRHRNASYWPDTLSVEVFDGPQLDKMVAAQHGPAVAWMLGTHSTNRSWPADGDAKYARHRVRTLLAHFELASIAARQGLKSVFVVEADIRPLGGTRALTASELARLSVWLRRRTWHTVRAAGLYRDFSGSYRRQPSACPAACRCRAVETLGERACEMTAPLVRADGPAVLSAEARAAGAICDVRDTVAYAISSAAFPIVERAKAHALRAIGAAYKLHQSGRAPRIINRTFGLAADGFGAAQGIPWIDIWMPAALNALHILPSIAVQQIKQADAESSVSFARTCIWHARRNASALHPSALIAGPRRGAGADGPPRRKA